MDNFSLLVLGLAMIPTGFFIIVSLLVLYLIIKGIPHDSK